jgi:hypothetical protein
MSANTPKHIEGIEGDLSKYNNTLNNVPGYSEEAFNQYVSEYADYFQETGADPRLAFAKTSLYNELGEEEYNRRGYKNYSNLDSLMNNYLGTGEGYPMQDSPFSIDSSFVNYLDTLYTEDQQGVPIPYNNILSDEEIFGNAELTAKSFFDVHPEYKNIDLDTRIELGIGGGAEFIITSSDGKTIRHIPRFGAPVDPFKAAYEKSMEEKLYMVDYWAERGRSRDETAQSLNPSVQGYDYIDMLNEMRGSEELELKYLIESPSEALNHWVKMGYSQEAAEDEVHKRIMQLEEKVREKTTFAVLDNERKKEIARQYELDKWLFDNPSIGEQEGKYLFSAFESADFSTKSTEVLANEILNKMVNGSYFEYEHNLDGTTSPIEIAVDTQKYLRMFDSIASDISPYYADLYRTGESFMSSKDKLKLLARFFALSRSAEGNEGVKVALEDLKGRLPQFEVPEINGGLKFLRTWGQQTASTGYSIAGILGGTGKWIIGNSPAPEGSGWFDRWMWSIGTTEAVQRAQLMSDSGLFVGFGKGENYELAKKLQRYGENINTIDNVVGNFFANQGYTAVTMLYTAGAAGLINKGAKIAGKGTTKLASKMATKQAFRWAGKVTEEIATKWSGRLLAFGILPIVSAGNEALMEGNDAYKQAVARGESAIDKMVSEALTEDLAMDSVGNFLNAEVADFFHSKTAHIQDEIDAITKKLTTLPGEAGTENESREELINRLNYLYGQLNREYGLVAEEYKDYKYGEAIRQAKERLEVEAVNAYASTVALDGLIISTCDLFFSSVLGPQVGRLLGKTGLVPEETLVKWVSKKAKDGVKPTAYNAVMRTLGNSASEGIEEHSMVLTRVGSTELAMNNLSNFFYNTTKAESEEALGYGLFSNMSTIASALGEAWISKEAWEAFGMGALGALFGSANTNVTTSDRQLKSDLAVATNTMEKIFAYANAVWRSPIFYETLNRRHHIVRANAAARYVNEAFEKNPELASAFESAKGLASYVNAFYDAKKRGDIVDMEDEEFGMFVSGANILAKLSDTAIGKSYKKYIKEILKVEANSEEGQNLISNYLSKLTDEERAKYEDKPEAALEEVKKRVKDFKSLQSRVNTVMSDIDNTYGNLIDERTKESIAFVYLAKDNMMERLASREEIIKSALSNDIVVNSERSTLTDEQKAVVAEYGSLENAMQVLKVLKQSKAHRADIKKVNKAISVFRSIKDSSTLLSAADILALRPVERASILSSENFELFSEEQQAVIEAIKRSTIEKEVFEAIEEAATIKSRLDLNDSIIQKLEDSDLNLFKLNTTLIKESTVKNANTKTALLKEVDSYEEFKAGLDALIASGKLTVPEEAVLGTSVFTDDKTREFYKRYSQGQKVVQSTMEMLSQMKRNTTDDRTKLIVDLVLKTLAQRMTSFEDRFNFDDATNLFTEGGFLNTLRTEHNIMWDAITEEDRNKILSELKRAMDIANIAISNREEVVQRYNAANPLSQVEQKANDNKIFNDVLYKRAKALYDAIFDKVARIYNGEKIELTALEMYQLASLMNKNVFLSPLDVDASLFKGMSVDLTSNRSIEKLYKALEDRKSLYEDTFSTYMQFIQGLSMLILRSRNNVLDTLGTGIVELNADFKDRFDKKANKESQKKINKGVKYDKRAKVVALNIIPLGSPHLTEVQKKWYDDNKIAENVMAVNERIARRNIRTFLIKDPALIESDRTYDSDNLPLAVVAEVGKNFPNAFKLGNKYYVYVGICENSRSSVTEDINILNVIRESAINDFASDEPTLITYSDTGAPVEFGGLNYNYAYKDGEVITSVKEKILRKYSHIENYEERLEAAYQDFCENTVKISESVTIDIVTKEVDGITVSVEVPTVHWVYTWKGVQYEKTYESTLDKHPIESKSKKLAYIMPNPESTSDPVVNLVFNNFYEMKYIEDGNTLTLKDVYDRIIEGKMNLFDPLYANTSLAFLHNCLNDLRSETTTGKIRTNLKKSGTNIEAARNTAAEDMRDKIQRIVSGYLNTKPKGQPAEIQYKVSIKDEVIKVTLVNPNLDDENAILDTVEISVKEFLKNGAAVEEFYQQIVFKTFYDTEAEEFRDHRYGNDMIPLVKLQLNYDKFDGSKPKERLKASDKEDKRRGAFLSGALYTDGKWTSRELVNMSATVVEEKKPQQPKEVIEKGKKHKELDVPPVTKPEVTVEEAMNTLLKFKQTKNSVGEARASGHMGVTTFISTDEKKERSKMTAQEALPFDLGTSLDYVVRRYLELGKDVEKTYRFIYDAYKHLTTDNNNCPIQGLNWTELREFINNIGTLVEFLENRGETIVPFDTLFTGTITSNDGKFAKLTAVPDIITIDKAGKLHIYDMKSYRAVDTQVEVPSFGPDGTFYVARGSYFNQSIGLNNDGSITHENGSFQKQTSLYAHVIGNATGLEVASVGIIPIPLYYETTGRLRRSNSELDIQGLNVFQFFNAGVLVKEVDSQDFKGKKELRTEEENLILDGELHRGVKVMIADSNNNLLNAPDNNYKLKDGRVIVVENGKVKAIIVEQFRLKRVPTFYGDAIKLPILPIESISSIKWSVPEEEAPIVIEDGEGDYVEPTGHEGNATGVVPSVTKGTGPRLADLGLPPGMFLMDDELRRMLEECEEL